MLRQRSLLHEFSKVQSIRIEARRQRTYANHERQLEERRLALLEKEALEEKHIQQQTEVGAALYAWEWVCFCVCGVD